MVEYRFFDEGTCPYVSTFRFHVDRERAPHLEQEMHQARLLRTADLIQSLEPSTVVDLGCGDGGLLSLLKSKDIKAWGYDFQPSNWIGWHDREVEASLHDVFNTKAVYEWAELAVVTEVLEHLAEPHEVVRWIAENARFIVASSPWGDTPEHHGVEHAWGWDFDGYAELFRPHFETLHHERVTWSQIFVGQSRYVGPR